MCGSECFKEFEHRSFFRLGQFVREQVSRSTFALFRRVEVASPLAGRRDRNGNGIEFFRNESNPFVIERVVLAGPDDRALAGVQHVPEGGSRSVVEIRGGGPDPVQRGCEIPLGFENDRILAVATEPTGFHPLPVFGCQCIEPCGVGPNDF